MCVGARPMYSFVMPACCRSAVRNRRTRLITADKGTSGYADLGTFEHTYDSSSNVLTAEQNDAMGAYLEADRDTVYDTLNRLITADHQDAQDWSVGLTAGSWYQYDDLGNRISHKNRAAGKARFAKGSIPKGSFLHRNGWASCPLRDPTASRSAPVVQPGASCESSVATPQTRVLTWIP